MICDHTNANVCGQHCLLVGREFQCVLYANAFYNKAKCARPSEGGGKRGTAALDTVPERHRRMEPEECATLGP